MCLSIRSNVTVQVRAPSYMQYDDLNGEAEVIFHPVFQVPPANYHTEGF
jgi:hypothetical protein